MDVQKCSRQHRWLEACRPSSDCGSSRFNGKWTVCLPIQLQKPSSLTLLARIGSIPDPFLDMNELDVEWVGETSWTYRTTFDCPKLSDGKKAYLLFDGLDTFAKARLNDVLILESENMFLSHRVNITDVMKQSESNTLVIDFDSALLRARELQKENSEHRFVAFNGEPARLTVRKAQYHWVSFKHICVRKRYS